MNFSKRNQKTIFIFYIVISVALRFFSFFPSVMDHDESTYLIIGRDILNGKDLYEDVTDTKPVGIFLFYAALEFLFGSSIFLKRLFFSLIVGITGFLVFKVSLKLFSERKTAFASGVIYILYVSIWNLHGLSPNTELLFNFFTICGLLLFLHSGLWNYFAGGLLMGAGFMVKYVVLFDFAAFMFFFFLKEIANPENRGKTAEWGKYLMAGAAFAIPFLLTNLWFWISDHFSDFVFVTYELPSNYGGSPSLKRYVVMLVDFTAKFLPISFLVFYVALKKEKSFMQNQGWFFMVWVCFVLFAMYIMGKEFSHYTIQLMLPFSLVAGLFFHPGFNSGAVPEKLYSGKTGAILLTSILLTVQINGIYNEIIKPDYEREVAAYLSERMDPGDQIYVSNYHQIVYYLLKIDSPTKFIHSNLLFTDTHKSFNINAEQEIKRILGNSPRFVIIKDQNTRMKNLISGKYTELKDFDKNKIQIYELKH